jgi:hypothetical protein
MRQFLAMNQLRVIQNSLIVLLKRFLQCLWSYTPLYNRQRELFLVDPEDHFVKFLWRAFAKPI